MMGTSHAGLSWMDLDPIVGAAIGFVVGMLLGALHFGSLWWNTRLYVKDGTLRAFGLQVLRFGLLFAVLAGLAKLGPLPLLAGALGLLVARGVLLRRLGKTS